VAANPNTTMTSKTEWFAFYNRWKVHRVDFRFSCMNLSPSNTVTDGFYMGWITGPSHNTGIQGFPGPAGGGINTWGDMMQTARTNPYCAAKLVGQPTGGNGIKTIKIKIPIAKMSGNKTYRTDEDYNGGSTAVPATSPNELFTGYFFLTNLAGQTFGNNLVVAVSATAKLYCSLFAESLDFN